MFIVTFTIVSISGYQVDNFFTLAYQRLSSVLAGGAICIIICMDLVRNIFIVHEDEEEKHVTDTKKDKSFLQEYKVVLDSSTTEESLANFGRWEPKHGKFGFHHPWKHYLKIGSLARQCAYGIEALNGYLSPENICYCNLEEQLKFYART
ncbi:unnamed protein product [Citrullus colocynthis]|uniref:Aluminum-activated malate transporter n=1 Tax=Citrullus colocynthis TaxID=252529 RepID=A0ABP0XXF8_9ROSI